MNLSEMASLIVAIVAGLGSGLVGSIVGSKAQRRLFDRQIAQDRNQALWAYENGTEG